MSNYYAETAYDSRKEYTPIEESEEHWEPSQLNGGILKWGGGVGWFFSVSNYKPKNLKKVQRGLSDKHFTAKSVLHDYKDTKIPISDHNSFHHDHMTFLSKQSLGMVLAMLFLLLRGMLIIFGLGFCLIAIIENDLEYITDTSTLLCFAVLTLLCVVIWFALKKGWIKPRTKAILFRSTGLIYVFPNKNGPAAIYPFTEFNAFLNRSANPKTGVLYADLFVAHRQDKEARFSPDNDIGGTMQEETIYMQWEYIQQFMDISKPLPDVPELEPFRHLDPVTAQWDKEHDRPPTLFANMSDTLYKKYRNKVWDYAKGYQWDKGREASIAEGWEPPPEKFWQLNLEQQPLEESTQTSDTKTT